MPHKTLQHKRLARKRLPHKRLAGAALATAFFAFPLYLLSRSAGAPNGSSGGDFPGEGSCASSSCHVGGEVNAGGGRFDLLINGAPAAEHRYTPGETVTVRVSIFDPQAERTGFQLTARAGNGCAPGGMLMPGETQVRVGSGDCNGESVQWATHTFAKAGNDAAFDVQWTAPMRDIGPVTLAAAGNGADGNGGRQGDNIYETQAVIQPVEGGGGGPAPAISTGGVVLATLAPAVNSGAPNAIASVFGTEFAPAGTAVSDPQLDGNGRVATTLAETCVEVGGRRAPLFAVFPGQINFQIPDQAGLGPQAVNVIRGCGAANERRSTDESFTVNAAQPAFFLFNAARQAVAAIHDDAVNRVGPADLMIPGVTTTPARPGEWLTVYGTGFGATDPPTAAGEIPESTEEVLRQLASHKENPGNVQATIGGITANVYWVGGAPCCAGLNQLIVQVPESAPAGELPLVVTIDGVSSPEGPFLAVGP